MSSGILHEELRGIELPQGSSDRTFGLVFVGAFTILAGLPAIKNHSLDNVRWWALAIAGIFLVFSLLKPTALAPLNKLWTKFGIQLNRVTSPIIMGILFFGLVTPVALVMKLLGRDPLKRKLDTKAKSYWSVREDHEPKPESLVHQF